MTNNRIIGLDIIRGLAVLIVVYAHGALVLPVALQQAYFDYLPPVDGVSLFFTLSGFLIGGIILKTLMVSDFTKADLLNFWIRRWIRTLPNYLLVLALIVGYRIIIFHDIRGFQANYLVFLQNFAWPHPKFFPEAWSLSIEEWFYLLFPLLLLVFYKFSKSRSKAFFWTILFFLIVPTLLRIAKFEFKIGPQNFDEGYRKIVILRLDSLMYGIFAAYIYAYKRKLWQKYKFLSLLIASSLFVIMKINPGNWVKFYPPISFNVESFVVLGFMPFFSELKTTGSKLADSFFTWLSNLSYALYLINLTLIIRDALPTTHNFLGWKKLAVEQTYRTDYVLFWVYSLVGAFLIYYFYERHMTKLRDRIYLPVTTCKKATAGTKTEP